MMRWMWYDGWQSGWVGILMGLMMLLFWGTIIVGVYFALRMLFRGDGGITQPDRTPLEILKERYAKGELTDVDFYRMRQKLEEK